MYWNWRRWVNKTSKISVPKLEEESEILESEGQQDEQDISS